MAIILLIALISSVFVSFHVSAQQSPTSVPKRYIVELDPTSGQASDIHANFYRQLDEQVNYNIFREYNSSDVFMGASIILESPADVSAVAGMQGVKSVKQVRRIARPSPVKTQILSSPNDPNVPPDSESTHKMIGVDKLHAMGITGKGVQIAFIDTGIDYTHPSLGGGFGPGHKVAGGFDFVGDDFNGDNTPMPDSDPLDQCDGHGTHVAGIAGADPGNIFNISGVAYDSTLFAYRVLGCTGSTTNDIVIDAVLQAQKDGANVMNLSLGGFSNWTGDMLSIVLSRLTRMGIIVVASCGNDGNLGGWSTNDISNSLGAIAVGSVDNTVLSLQNATTSDPAHPEIPYALIFPLPVEGALPIFATSNDTSVVDDACNPLPDDTPDLSKFLVIVGRGTCSFVTKLQNIAEKGANFSFIYDNGMGLAAIDTGSFNHTALISQDDGRFLVEQFAAGKNITVSFPQGGFATIDSPTGGLVSTFSSQGPTNDLFFKPAVATPGGNVVSTFPVNLGNFALESGTSMASPQMAGCAALLLQVKGKSQEVIEGALALFETTAQMVPSSHNGGDPLQTLALQGAGLVNAHNAITYMTRLSPGELLLNDSNHFVERHTLTITNTGPKSETYNVTHIPAGTSLTYQTGSIFPVASPVPLTTDYATAEIEPRILTIPPSGEAKVIVTIKPPQKVDPQTFPVYSGFIQVQGIQNGEKLHTSYLGLQARAIDLKVIDNTNETLGIQLPSLSDVAGNPITEPRNYTFQQNDHPTLLFRLASASPLVRADLVESHFTLPTRNIPSKGALLGNITDFKLAARSVIAPSEGMDNGTYTVNMTTATLGDNSTIPNGQYRILLRALKTSGDRNKEGDYEAFLSPIVGVSVPGQ